MNPAPNDAAESFRATDAEIIMAKREGISDGLIDSGKDYDGCTQFGMEKAYLEGYLLGQDILTKCRAGRSGKPDAAFLLPIPDDYETLMTQFAGADTIDEAERAVAMGILAWWDRKYPEVGNTLPRDDDNPPP